MSLFTMIFTSSCIIVGVILAFTGLRFKDLPLSFAILIFGLFLFFGGIAYALMEVFPMVIL